MPHVAPIAPGCTASDQLPRQTHTLVSKFYDERRVGPTEGAGIAAVKCAPESTGVSARKARSQLCSFAQNHSVMQRHTALHPAAKVVLRA